MCRVCFQLPRAVNTQALSGAGILKMINKASDAVNKMTIKMNESDSVRSICMRCLVLLRSHVVCVMKLMSSEHKSRC